MGLVLRVCARRARRLLLLAGLVFAALPAASALANTTIGKTGGDIKCDLGGRIVVGDTAYVVPFGGGTITSFSFQSSPRNAGRQLDFLVLRPEPEGRYQVVGKTGVVTLGFGHDTFSANISVDGG
ncbi:MAG: hypothetical protein JO372_25200, partial [Solirubrobacterales bacterium]|nr:hypothetical protein [Solirubrobacterales bacterium]